MRSDIFIRMKCISDIRDWDGARHSSPSLHATDLAIHSEGVMKRLAAMKFAGTWASVLAATFAAAFILAIPAAVAATYCAKHYYACNINADGSLDRLHPGCCLHVPGIQHACSPGYYACQLNAGGLLDRAHPGCCLNVPGVPHSG